MRIVKIIVGWLCVVSIVTSLLFAGYRAYLEGAPFFRGAYVESHRRGSHPQTIISHVSEKGLRRISPEALRALALRDVEVYRRRGLDAAVSYVTSKPSVSTGDVVVLVDARGRLVAAYPKSLLGSLPRFDANNSGDWLRSLYHRAMETTSHLQHPELYPITDPAGKEIGHVAVAWNTGPIAVIPAGSGVRGIVSSSVCRNVVWLAFFGYCVLLVVWVTMDASWRGMRGLAWGTLVLITNFIGLLAYLVARIPPPRPCPNCRNCNGRDNLCLNTHCRHTCCFCPCTCGSCCCRCRAAYYRHLTQFL